MSRDPKADAAWGTWDDAERWRREAFQRRSPAARLAWLEDVWLLSTATRLRRRRAGIDEDAGEETAG